MLTEVQAAKRFTGDIRYTGLREAMEFLGVSKPVNIKRSCGLRRAGAHRFREGEHHITVSTYSTKLQANETILHELMHASQLERFEDPRKFAMEYNRANFTTGYRSNPFEIEAREAQTLTDDFQVVR